MENRVGWNVFTEICCFAEAGVVCRDADVSMKLLLGKFLDESECVCVCVYSWVVRILA